MTDTQNPNHNKTRCIKFNCRNFKDYIWDSLTPSHARRYNKHISEFEKEQKDLLHLAKEQMNITKTQLVLSTPHSKE